MSRRTGTVVLDNEAVGALADPFHPKHATALAVLEVTNQRRSRGEHVTVVVPAAVRIEAGWDRRRPGAANLNRLSRARDIELTSGAADRACELRLLVPSASVVDVTVAHAAEAATARPVTIATSDTGDFERLIAKLAEPVLIARL